MGLLPARGAVERVLDVGELGLVALRLGHVRGVVVEGDRLGGYARELRRFFGSWVGFLGGIGCALRDLRQERGDFAMCIFERFFVLDGFQFVFRRGDSGGKIARFGRLANADHRQLHAAQAVLGMAREVFQISFVLLDGLGICAGFERGIGLRENIVARFTS